MFCAGMLHTKVIMAKAVDATFLTVAVGASVALIKIGPNYPWCMLL